MTRSDERLREARLLAGTGRAAEALAQADAILDEDPEHLDALLLKAALVRQAGAPEAALALYERAVRLAPQSAQARNEQASSLHALGRDDEALEAAEQARILLAQPDNARHRAAVSLTLMWCLREKRRLRDALAVAEECLALVPDAVVAEWAGQIESELMVAERERC